ncbi:MAG: T9SS type A sorting domain-containing protein [Bacteroidetes bacterium]|nr:T9SS type A sorting domain-containing protein [Bacteroidota bacterium]
MKNKLTLLAVCSCIALGLSAQRYVNAVTGASAGQINEVIETEWNSGINNPTVLMDKTSGFALMNFNESNGALLAGFGIDLNGGALNRYHPVAMAQVGNMQMVVGQDRDNIYYTLVYSNTGVVLYSFGFAKTNITGINLYQDAIPVDIVYDGGLFCYLLTESTVTSAFSTSVRSFGFLKINVMNGSVNTFAIDASAKTGINKYPNDIEYVDNTHIYVSGVTEFQGTKRFFVDNILTPNNIYQFAYSTSSLTPAHCYVKASGTTLWLSCDMNNSLNSTSPLVLMRVTDTGSGFTVNNASTYNYSMLKIVSVDFRSNYLLIGSTNATNSQPQQFLFNTSTASLTSLSSYSTTGSNVKPYGIYCSASQRIFTALCDNSVNVLYNLRTDVNSTATNCHSSITSLPKSITVPVTTITPAWKLNDPVLMNMTYATVSYLLTQTAQCQTFAQNETESNNQTLSRIGSSSLIAPNPSNDYIQINAAEQKEITQIEIYSFNGQLIERIRPENGTAVTFSTSHLNNGIYLFIIHNNDGTVENRNVAVQH